MFFRASGCHIVNGDSTQEQNIIPDADVLVIYIAEAGWLGQKTYSIGDTRAQEFFWPCCRYFGCDLTVINPMI